MQQRWSPKTFEAEQQYWKTSIHICLLHSAITLFNTVAKLSSIAVSPMPLDKAVICERLMAMQDLLAVLKHHRDGSDSGDQPKTSRKSHDSQFSGRSVQARHNEEVLFCCISLNPSFTN